MKTGQLLFEAVRSSLLFSFGFFILKEFSDHRQYLGVTILIFASFSTYFFFKDMDSE